MTENEVAIPKAAGVLTFPSVRIETRIEEIRVFHRPGLEAGQRGTLLSQLALTLNCRKADALDPVVEGKKYHKVFLDGLVLLDGGHQEETSLGRLDWDDLNAPLSSGVGRNQTNCSTEGVVLWVVSEWCLAFLDTSLQPLKAGLQE